MYALYRVYTKEWCGFNSFHYWNCTILLCIPCTSTSKQRQFMNTKCLILQTTSTFVLHKHQISLNFNQADMSSSDNRAKFILLQKMALTYRVPQTSPHWDHTHVEVKHCFNYESVPKRCEMCIRHVERKYLSNFCTSLLSCPGDCLQIEQCIPQITYNRVKSTFRTL